MLSFCSSLGRGRHRESDLVAENGICAGLEPPCRSNTRFKVYVPRSNFTPVAPNREITGPLELEDFITCGVYYISVAKKIQ